jgi:hypothetical protein
MSQTPTRGEETESETETDADMGSLLVERVGIERLVRAPQDGAAG